MASRLDIVFGARDEASPSVERIANRINRMTKATQLVARAFALGFAGRVLAGFVDGVMKASDRQKDYARSIEKSTEAWTRAKGAIGAGIADAVIPAIGMLGNLAKGLRVVTDGWRAFWIAAGLGGGKKGWGAAGDIIGNPEKAAAYAKQKAANRLILDERSKELPKLHEQVADAIAQQVEDESTLEERINRRVQQLEESTDYLKTIDRNSKEGLKVQLQMLKTEKELRDLRAEQAKLTKEIAENIQESWNETPDAWEGSDRDNAKAGLLFDYVVDPEARRAMGAEMRADSKKNRRFQRVLNRALKKQGLIDQGFSRTLTKQEKAALEWNQLSNQEGREETKLVLLKEIRDRLAIP